MPPRRRKARPIPCPPPPRWSERLYLRVQKAHTALFRFLLEAHDNLALFTVADPRAAILQLRFSPHQGRQVQAFLREIADIVPHEVVYRPNDQIRVQAQPAIHPETSARPAPAREGEKP